MNKRIRNPSARKSFKTCLHLNFSAPLLFCGFLIYRGYQSWVKFQRCIELASWFSSAFWTGPWAELSSCCVAQGSYALKVPLPQPRGLGVCHHTWFCSFGKGLSGPHWKQCCEDISTVLFFLGPNPPTRCSLAGNYRLNQGFISY